MLWAVSALPLGLLAAAAASAWGSSRSVTGTWQHQAFFDLAVLLAVVGLVSLTLSVCAAAGLLPLIGTGTDAGGAAEERDGYRGHRRWSSRARVLPALGCAVVGLALLVNSIAGVDSGLYVGAARAVAAVGGLLSLIPFTVAAVLVGSGGDGDGHRRAGRSRGTTGDGTVDSDRPVTARPQGDP